MEHVWHMYGTCVACVWNMCRICVTYVWYMYGACVAYVWNVQSNWYILISATDNSNVLCKFTYNGCGIEINRYIFKKTDVEDICI